MKAMVCYKQNDLRFENIPEPEILDNEVLIKMDACGLCGTDIHKIKGSTITSPTVLGHEVVGRIVKKGQHVTNYSLNERIITAIHVPCFTCHYCNKGQYTICEQFRTNNIIPGGFSEYIRIPEIHLKHLTYRVSDRLSDDEATFVEPLGCCLHGIKQANIQPGDRVLVMGAGTIGMLSAQLAKVKGAGQVFISDLSEFRLEMALKVGCDYAINIMKDDINEKISKLTRGEGVDVIIIAAGISSLVSDGINLLRRAGKIIVFAGFDKNPLITIDANRFFKDEIRIIGSYSLTPYELPEALHLLETDQINVKEMITHRFNLSELQHAVDLASNPNEKVMKVIITP